MGQSCAVGQGFGLPEGCDDTPGFAELPSFSPLLSVGNQEANLYISKSVLRLVLIIVVNVIIATYYYTILYYSSSSSYYYRCCNQYAAAHGDFDAVVSTVPPLDASGVEDKGLFIIVIIIIIIISSSCRPQT